MSKKSKIVLFSLIGALILLILCIGIDFTITHGRYKRTITCKVLKSTKRFARKAYRWTKSEGNYVVRTPKKGQGKIYKGKYANDFNDLQSKHEAAVKEVLKKHKLLKLQDGHPIALVKRRDNVADFTRKYGFVNIATCESFKVDALTHSHPYVLPETKNLIENIAKDFQAELAKRNMPKRRILLSSVTRTVEDVRNLSKNNFNASRHSVHQFGTTFDITYKRFANTGNGFVYWDGELKEVLAFVLKKYKDAGKCCVKYEKRQACFHITVK